MKKKIILAIVKFLCQIHVLQPIHVARLKHFYKFRRFPDYEHPHDINEKMNWIKFYGDTSRWADLTDKYKVRQFIEAKGYGDTLVKLYGKWDSVDDIDWQSLPNQFIMKMNNGSGDVIICRDKKTFDLEKAKKEIRRLFSIKYGITTGEPHYGGIQPCVIAEELLDANAQPIRSSSLVDYKIWVLDGKPFGVWVAYNRQHESIESAFYDMDWNYRPEYSIFFGHYKEASQRLPKPRNFDRMIEMASALAEGFHVLRCDLYEVDGKIYFGEMTFTSLGGFMDYLSNDCLVKMGEQVNLNLR